MGQFKDTYGFDWLPGFKEMMICQETDGEEQAAGTEQEMGGNEQESDFAQNPETGRQQKEETVMLPPEKLQQEEQAYWKDYEYMIRMLPAVAREIWAVVDAILDRYEFEGSSMYAEYPDKNAILKITETIYDKVRYYECNPTENKVDGSQGKNCYYQEPEERGENTPLRHLILTMICWNMAYRRQRFFRRKKIFPLS